MEASPNKPEKIKLDFKDSKYATGRRKTSIAKIWLKKGSGKIYVNGKNYDDYFKRENHKMQLLRPFEIISQPTEYDVRCNVKGGYNDILCRLIGSCRPLILYFSISSESISSLSWLFKKSDIKI